MQKRSEPNDIHLFGVVSAGEWENVAISLYNQATEESWESSFTAFRWNYCHPKQHSIPTLSALFRYLINSESLKGIVMRSLHFINMKYMNIDLL